MSDTVTITLDREEAKNLLAWTGESAVDVDVHLCRKLRAALDQPQPTSVDPSRLHRCFTERLSRFGWRAECSCGWKGRRRWHPLLAERDADRHLAEICLNCGGPKPAGFSICSGCASQLDAGDAD